jgi:hypothetical protein
MPFFFRIIAKNSKCNELPEVSLRRSPTAVLQTNITDNSPTASKKRNVSFKEDVETFGIKAEKDARSFSCPKSGGMGKAGNGNLSSDFKKSPQADMTPRVESIKLKFDVSNNNVSIIKSDSASKIDLKSSLKQQRSYEKKEKKNKLEKYADKSPHDKVFDKKDEYEFEDDIEKEKLGFLNTFQLTAKKMLTQKYSSQTASQNKMQVKKDESTTSTKFEEGKIHSKSVESSANKRKNKEPVKSEKTKKYKFHEMKSVGEGNKFLFTKTGDGHEITFDMSPKPLGSKPPLSKVKSDILMAQQRADAKAIQSKVESSASVDKNQTNKNAVPKPKKLPLLLPKQVAPPPNQNVISTSVAPTSMSPTAFVIQKPALSKEPEISSNSEISVTKINETNHHYRVYGPKSPDRKPKEIDFKSPDTFAQPLPPKPKPNLSPFAPPTTIMPPSSLNLKPSPKQPKNIHENMQTPYGNRTPFYVPSSPSYIPNFDPKPQFKYANPNMQFASFMQSMFTAQSSPQSGKISPPNTTPKTNQHTRKRPSTDSSSNVLPNKRKSPSPTKTGETDSKAISILNKINFPSSLSVTLTNEQEENKKEQLRNQQQNVNNNIEIIKISEENKAKSKSPSPPKTGNSSDTCDKKPEKKLPELKKLLPSSVNIPSSMPPPAIPAVSKALSEKESFQRAFLESIMSVSNRQDRNVERPRKKSTSPDSSKNNKSLNNNDAETMAKESKLESTQNSKNSSFNTSSPSIPSGKKSLSLTPPLSKNIDKSNNTATSKSLTPPPQIPIQDHSIFSPAVAASSAIQFNLMMNALNAPHFGVFPDYANIQRNILLETLRKNVEKSNALLAMHHQMQQQQNQKASPNSSSSSSKQ